MASKFAVSRDGGRIAYEVAGDGATLILLHGGGQDHHVWRTTGWMERLAGRFQVIAMDLRGHGESWKPIDSAAYNIDQMCDDILCVADAEGASRFRLWGYSYGGNIGRYLAARSDRVECFAMMGVSFGPAANETFREMIREMQKRWEPVLAADSAGKLDIEEITEQDRSAWRSGQVRVMLAWLGALLDWPPIEPADMRCPTLWIIGTSNASAMRGVNTYQAHLLNTKVRLSLVERLTHSEELERVDQMLPELLRFTAITPT